MHDLLLILIVVVLLGGIAPVWPYSRGWGPQPLVGLIFLLIILRILGLI